MDEKRQKALNEVNEGIRKRNRWIEEKVIDRELEHGIMSWSLIDLLKIKAHFCI